MIILSSIKYGIDRWLQWGVLLSIVGVSVSAGWVVCAVLWESSRYALKQMHTGENERVHSVYLYPLDAIGSGPLALHPKMAAGWLSRIAEEFSVISFNSRPDVLQKDAKILVSLRDSKDLLTFSNGKMAFLQERTEGKGFTVAETATALWVRPLLLDNGNVLIEAGRKCISKEGQISSEEKGEFIAFPVGSAERHIPCLGALKTACYLGQDPLIAKYGGKEYASWRDKIRIEFSSQENGIGRTYACFVSTGDFLYYKEGEWRSVAADPATQCPMARVISATSKGVEIEGWDESGFYSTTVKIEAHKFSPPSLPQELLPSSLRLRSYSQVSCVLGKKRLILKKGDWLLKTQWGWRTLKRASEIDDCLHHRLKGELLIFDEIEKQQGKCVLVGHLFDSSRLTASPISLAIDTEKKGSQKTHKKGKKL